MGVDKTNLIKKRDDGGNNLEIVVKSLCMLIPNAEDLTK